MKQGCNVHGRQLRHSWTDNDRIVLALLCRFYKNSPDERRRIWNHLLNDTLTSEGFPRDQYPLSALSTQVWQMEKNRSDSGAWHTVMRMPLAQARKMFAALKDSIEEAGQDLQIELRLNLEGKARDELRTKTSRPEKRKAVVVAHIDDWSSYSESESDIDESPQKKQAQKRATHQKLFDRSLIQSFTYDDTTNKQTQIQSAKTPARAPATSKFFESGRPSERAKLVSRDLSDPGSPRHPTLLFRAAEGNLFRSRKHAKTDTQVPPPPPMASEAFYELLDPHLRQYLPTASYKSPFISLAESPERALGIIAKKKHSHDSPRSLAIFEFAAVSKDGVARYGSLCKPYPYLGRAVVKQHNMNDLPKDYTAVGEYLCYGSIDCDPIAVLETATSCKLYAVMSSLKAIDEEAAEKVGPLLVSISDRWRECVARKLLTSFKVSGYKNTPDSLEYDEFMDAVYAVARGNRALSIFSEYDELPVLKEQPMIIIPVSVRSKGKRKEKELEQDGGVFWQPVQNDGTGPAISVAVPKDHQAAEMRARDLQEMLDSQFASEGIKYGIGVDRASTIASESVTSPSVFLSQVQKAAHTSPSPLPPRNYSLSPVTPATKDINSAKTTIVDLCDAEECIDEVNDELWEVPSFDLTSGVSSVNDPDDIEIIGTARFSRAGRSIRAGHSNMVIRSRSRSSAAALQDTPTHRPPKRTRGGALKLQR